MTGLSDLSDDELKALYAKQQPAQPQNVDLSSMSDDDLKALYAKQQPQDEHYGRTFWGNVAKGYWPTSEQVSNLASDAAQRMKTGIKETIAPIPFVGASVPRDAAMDQYEKDNPGVTAINKVGGAASVAIPLSMAAPAAMGLEGPTAARIATGAVSNAGIGSGDTATRGGSWDDVKRSAIINAIFGGLPGVAGKIVNPGVSQAAANKTVEYGIPFAGGLLGAGHGLATGDLMHAAELGLGGSIVPGYGAKFFEGPITNYLTGNNVLARALASQAAKGVSPLVPAATQYGGQELNRQEYFNMP